MAAKFKIGDRVRLIDRYADGDPYVGTITGCENGAYVVRTDDVESSPSWARPSCTWVARELEPVGAAIARASADDAAYYEALTE